MSTQSSADVKVKATKAMLRLLAQPKGTKPTAHHLVQKKSKGCKKARRHH